LTGIFDFQKKLSASKKPEFQNLVKKCQLGNPARNQRLHETAIAREEKLLRHKARYLTTMTERGKFVQSVFPF